MVESYDCIDDLEYNGANMCIPVWPFVCVLVTPHLVHTLIRMCTFNNISIHVHLTLHACSTSLHSCVQTCVPLCGAKCMSQSPLLWSHTLVRMCTCISTCMHVHLTSHIWSTPFEKSCTNMCALMWPCMHVQVTLVVNMQVIPLIRGDIYDQR